jgi:branched-chain amino acid transport system permease protein
MNKKRDILKDPYLVIFLLFLIYPFIPFIGKYKSLGAELLIWSIFALSFNLVLGYTGLPSFGHGAFYGVGTYAVALTITHVYSKGVIIPLLIAALFGGLFTFFYGYFIKKKRGIYFALLTVAFSQILYVIAFRWNEVTGGETGITSLKIGTFLGIGLKDPLYFYYFTFLVFVITSIMIRKIANSPVGKVLLALKQDEKRTQYLGFNTEKYVWYIFTVSGIFAGLAGGMYGLLHCSAFADTLHWVKSGDVVMATLLGGGLVNFYGPIVGSVIFITAREFLSSFWDNWMLLYGFSFVIIILFIPTGLLGIVEKIKEKKHAENFNNGNNHSKRDKKNGLVKERNNGPIKG